jgi:hypothetical protein
MSCRLEEVALLSFQAMKPCLMYDRVSTLPRVLLWKSLHVVVRNPTRLSSDVCHPSDMIVRLRVGNAQCAQKREREREEGQRERMQAAVLEVPGVKCPVKDGSRGEGGERRTHTHTERERERHRQTHTLITGT